MLFWSIIKKKKKMILMPRRLLHFWDKWLHLLINCIFFFLAYLYTTCTKSYAEWIPYQFIKKKKKKIVPMLKLQSFWSNTICCSYAEILFIIPFFIAKVWINIKKKKKSLALWFSTFKQKDVENRNCMCLKMRGLRKSVFGVKKWGYGY